MSGPMGRPRTRDFDLPPLMIRRDGRYYYGRNQTALGPDFRAALRKYAELHVGQADPGTFADAADAYRKLPDGLRAKRASTQREYGRQLDVLISVFGRMRLDGIKPRDVAAFLAAASEKPESAPQGGRRKRGGPIAATRMKALLSTVFNFARVHGLTDAPNPCAGVRGKKSERGIYVGDAELATVLAHADGPTATFLELAYRTGADASVILGLRLSDVQDGALRLARTKTGEKVAVTVEGPLKALVDGLARRPVRSMYLVADDRGQPFTLQAMRRRFWKARQAAGASWQIRDLRAKAGSDADSIADARALLGHRHETTTAIYRRLRGQAARPIARRITGK